MGKSKTGAPQKRRPYLQLTRRGTYGSLLLIAAACAWMFFVGVLVGRGTAPIHFDMEALNRELKALKQSSEERRRRQLDSYAAAMEDQSALDVYAELKRSDDKLTIDPTLSRRVPAPVDQEDAADRSPDASPVIKRREGLRPKIPGRLALKVRPSAGSRAPSRTVDDRSKASTTKQGKFTVQVAALKDGQMAAQMVARLRREGFDAFLSTTTIAAKGTWHRVRIGHYPDAQAAVGVVRR
ncbi:MAG: SPOR domain-containing protein, partial [Desulfobacterales bacterium]